MRTIGFPKFSPKRMKITLPNNLLVFSCSKEGITIIPSCDDFLALKTVFFGKTQSKGTPLPDIVSFHVKCCILIFTNYRKVIFFNELFSFEQNFHTDPVIKGL